MPALMTKFKTMIARLLRKPSSHKFKYTQLPSYVKELTTYENNHVTFHMGGQDLDATIRHDLHESYAGTLHEDCLYALVDIRDIDPISTSHNKFCGNEASGAFMLFKVTKSADSPAEYHLAGSDMARSSDFTRLRMANLIPSAENYNELR